LNSERILKSSDDFIKVILENSIGNFSKAEYDSLFKTFNKEFEKYYFTRNSESNLIRIFKSIFNKVLFLKDCLQYPHHIEIIVAISANSNFLTDVAVRNTEFLYQLFNPSYLLKELSQTQLRKEIKTGLSGYKSFDAKVNYLRIVKSRYILKIGLNDILENISLPEITSMLSVLAKVINAFLFQLCFDQVASENEIKPGNIKYCLIALGKLGGDELNYSSDIDLILVHETDKKTNVKKTVLEFLNDSAKLFVETATERTSRGYLYRIDFRLRPDGKTSPLSIAFPPFVSYYETRGEPWERQMMIKSSFVAGSTKLYEEISGFTGAYVYHSLRDSTPLAEIRRMKENIESQSDSEKNIKTARGGIRDIEFSIQALQLLNGYKHTELRSPNTLAALKSLSELSLISKEETSELSEAYILYRKIEHYLQLMNDTQTHVIPDDKEMLNKLANYCGLKSEKMFGIYLKKCKKNVRKFYESVIFEEEPDQQKENNIDSIKFTNPNRALTNLSYLEYGTGLIQQKQFDSITTENFNKFSGNLLTYLAAAEVPDLILENLAKIVHSTRFISSFYRELKDNQLLRGILKICETSQYTVDLILSESSLLDLLLTRAAFIPNPDPASGNFSIKQIRFILSVQYTLGIIGQQQLSAVYSEYIRHQLKSLIEDQDIKHSYLMAGLGSFGVNEMNLNSDVDLVILVDSEKVISEVEEKFTAFLKDANELLKPIEIDFRLRPEGKSSQLVWDINNYKKYLSDRADVWELMSFLKISYVAGDKNIFGRLQHAIVKSANAFPKQIVRDKINEMYNKYTLKPSVHGLSRFDIKRSKGGLATINFIVQAIILLEEEIGKEYLGKDTRDLIDRLDSSKNYAGIKELKRSFDFFKDLENSILFSLNTHKLVIPEDKGKKGHILRCANITSPEKFNNKLGEFIKLNNKMFAEYVQT
jgi:glutamate-ammonia-ligase adenylyltransferase